jgi:hypothetical protein
MKNALELMMPPLNATIQEGVDYVLRIAENGGGECPCCRQRVQVYERTINAGMARALINQWRAVGQDWAKTRMLWTMTHEGAQLQWWGLIEPGQARSDGGKGGEWRITDSGRDFVLGRLSCPRYAKVFDGQLLGLDASYGYVTIQDALGTKFDYSSLMSGPGA